MNWIRADATTRFEEAAPSAAPLQLFSVLKDEMPILGPRACVTDMVVGNEPFSDLVAP
ncbi:hypothetical protein [Roseomonas sp. WA12]